MNEACRQTPQEPPAPRAPVAPARLLLAFIAALLLGLGLGGRAPLVSAADPFAAERHAARDAATRGGAATGVLPDGGRIARDAAGRAGRHALPRDGVQSSAVLQRRDLSPDASGAGPDAAVLPAAAFALLGFSPAAAAAPADAPRLPAFASVYRARAPPA